MERREFLTGTMGAVFVTALRADPAEQRASSDGWDPGRVRHVLPAVSDTRMLVKTSFTERLSGAPTLRIGGTAVRGRIAFECSSSRAPEAPRATA